MVGAIGDAAQAAVIVQIKAEMGARDWKQPDLAAAAGLQRSTLHRYLSGERDMPLPVMAEISVALGLTFTGLLERAQARQDGTATL